MPHSEAQAWWADVQHVRETIERRRAGLAESPAPRDAGTETRFERRAAAPAPAVDDLDWTQVSATGGGGRADHSGRIVHGDDASTRARRPGPDGSDRAAGRARRNADHLETESRGDRGRGARRQAAEPHATGSGDSIVAPLAPPPSRRTV